MKLGNKTDLRGEYTRLIFIPPESVQILLSYVLSSLSPNLMSYMFSNITIINVVVWPNKVEAPSVYTLFPPFCKISHTIVHDPHPSFLFISPLLY